MSAQFERGACVRLRSGGPTMTVVDPDAVTIPPSVEVVWFDPKGHIHREWFPDYTIKPVTPEGADR